MVRSSFSSYLWLSILFLPVRALSQSLPLNPEKLRNARQVEREALAKKDSLMLAEAYYLYGKMYAFAGDATKAYTFFLRSRAILEPRGDSFELGRIYCRLSENTKLLNATEENRYVRLAIGVFQRIGSLKGQVTAYGLLGQLYHHRSSLENNRTFLDSCLQCFTKVESLSRQLGDTLAMAEANMHMAEYYGNYNPASIPFLEKALRFFEAKGSRRATLTAMMHLADAHIEAGELAKGYQEANRAKQIYKETRMSDLVLDSGLDAVIVKYFERSGQWQRAFSNYRILHLKESNQFKKDRDEAFLRLQTQYETGRKDALLSVQQHELGLQKKLVKTQRTFIVATTILSILATALSILFFRISRTNRRTSIRNEQLVREQNHRVKNNLQMISSLLNMQARLLTDSDARSAIKESRLRVQSMAIIQRKLYDRTDLTDIDLPDFIAELAEAALLACGFGKVRPDCEIEPVKLDVDRTISLGLILTELIINTCKYAFPGNPAPALGIECREEGGEVVLVVRDNGPGFEIDDESDGDTQVGKRKNNFGTQLLDLQVNQLYGKYWFSNEIGAVFTMKFRK